jgi:branched-chain amino acid transport system permease protein
MTSVAVAIISGFEVGATLALIALGIAVAFRGTETMNFAHGELMLLPAYIVGWGQARSHLPFGVLIALALLVGGAVAVTFHFLVLRRLSGGSLFTAVVATLGLASLLDAIMAILFPASNTYEINLSWLPSGTLSVLGARVGETDLMLAIFSLAVALTVACLLRFTAAGTRLRASGQDPLLASQGGIRVSALHSATWALVGALAGLAGICSGLSSVVSPAISGLALLALPVVFLGGLDSIFGVIVAGLLIGVMQGFINTYWSANSVDVVTYVVLLLVIVFLPHGLFGTRAVRRV